MTRRILIAITAIYWIGLCVITHMPPRNLPRVNVSDKLEHFAAYAVLAALLCASMTRSRRGAMVVLLICLIYGAVDELTQPLFGRFCDIRDWLADATGSAIAAGIFWLIRK